MEAYTSKKYLEEKVEDLTRHLKGNVEKLAVHERRPITFSQTAEQDVRREQQLGSCRLGGGCKFVGVAISRKNVTIYTASRYRHDGEVLSNDPSCQEPLKCF